MCSWDHFLHGHCYLTGFVYIKLWHGPGDRCFWDHFSGQLRNSNLVSDNSVVRHDIGVISDNGVITSDNAMSDLTPPPTPIFSASGCRLDCLGKYVTHEINFHFVICHIIVSKAWNLVCMQQVSIMMYMYQYCMLYGIAHRKMGPQCSLRKHVLHIIQKIYQYTKTRFPILVFLLAIP